MKKYTRYIVIVFFTVLASCVSSPRARNGQSLVSDGTSAAGLAPTATVKPETISVPVSGHPPAAANPVLTAELDALAEKARESIEANRLAEGMQFYISALGRASRAGIQSRTEELTDILNSLGAKLTIEPSGIWIASDGSQRAGDVRSAARGEGLMPTVYLYESYGFGKSVVPDAMIRFEFVTNKGRLNETVRTNHRGIANTTISSIASPGKDATIRAFPIFSSEGYTFALRTVFRDFTYLAPPNIAIVIALERTPFGFTENPRVLDAVASSLKPLGIQTIGYNGVLDPGRFMSAFGGDRNDLASFAGSTNPGFFALLLVEIGTPVQMQLQGRLYTIFTAIGRATIRIVRADGTIVFAEAKDGIRGQGGSGQAAVDDSLVKIRSEMTTLIADRTAAIQKALFE